MMTTGVSETNRHELSGEKRRRAIYENGQHYHITKRLEMDEPATKQPSSAAELREMIESHIVDPDAGGDGSFVMRCSPS